jgi:hypothetical protein
MGTAVGYLHQAMVILMRTRRAPIAVGAPQRPIAANERKCAMSRLLDTKNNTQLRLPATVEAHLAGGAS